MLILAATALALIAGAASTALLSARSAGHHLAGTLAGAADRLAELEREASAS